MISKFNSMMVSRRPDFVPEGLYGKLEGMMRGYRDSFPLDLSAEKWRAANPDSDFLEWRKMASEFLRDNLHYNAGTADLKSETHFVERREGFIAELVSFQTAPWCRVEGWFLRPEGKGPFPAIVAMHSWGGPMILGKDRLVSRGKEHPVLNKFLHDTGSGFWAEDLARRGYAVIVIDAHHFGARLPWGAQIKSTLSEKWLPDEIDPLDLNAGDFVAMDNKARELMDISLRYLQWAGTTWAGVNFSDDSRCVDYLISRPEVDAARIGCVGQSGGGWRVHMLAALDERIAASVSSCWTTTGNWNQVYSFTGTVGVFCLLPGVWQRMDVPDIALMAAPRAAMVISGQDDPLFPPEGMEEAAQRIREGFQWAGHPSNFQFHYPKKGHSFDRENQQVAWAWFDRWLKHS